MLRSLVVVGLVAAGLAAVSAALTVIGADDGAIRVGWPVGDDLVTRLASIAPLVVTAVIAGYVAWCAFATLGEVPEVADGEGSTGDLGTAMESRWEIPPSPPTIDPDGGSWARPPAPPGPGG